MTKMRILSFVSLVNKWEEISFEDLSKELQINLADVESFIIDGKCDFRISYFC